MLVIIFLFLQIYPELLDLLFGLLVCTLPPYFTLHVFCFGLLQSLIILLENLQFLPHPRILFLLLLQNPLQLYNLETTACSLLFPLCSLPLLVPSPGHNPRQLPLQPLILPPRLHPVPLLALQIPLQLQNLILNQPILPLIVLLHAVQLLHLLRFALSFGWLFVGGQFGFAVHELLQLGLG
jgi:hypothetical protein